MGPPRHSRTKEAIREYLLNHRKIDPDTGCWLWTGALTGNGYGLVTRRPHQYLVHKLAAWVWLGEPPRNFDPERQAQHTCDIRRCFNPHHLYIGTQSQNTKEGWERTRRVRI